MQKFQLGLIAMLICCVAFISCERTQKMMAPAEPVEEAMPTDMTDMMDMMADYMSWAKVELPAPPAAFTDAKDSGGAHGAGTRTVYINEAGAAAQAAAMETYPVGTMIVKEIMDDTNTFVFRVATMTKTDDEMHDAHNGWMYTQSARESADAELMPEAGYGTERGSMGCHGCHAQANTDSVFVKLPAAEDDSGTTMPVEFEQVLIYIGDTWYITPEAATAEAETTKSLLQSASIQAEMTEDGDYVREWMLQTTADGTVNVLMLYGVIPDAIYPTGNTQADGSVAENWIESPDGNTILNQADYIGWNSDGDTYVKSEGGFTQALGTENYRAALQNLMDIPHIAISTTTSSIPMTVTGDGSALTPSLVDFSSARPFPLDQFQGEWFAERVLASDTGDTNATLADPVIVRDGDRGRIAIVHQTFFEDNPKGEVAAELIINYLLAEEVE